ncbi:hypothetical protein Pst134EB_023879 [Puccinia striiformis f. sp. tritici]|nr:hypothetical protein Pst134EB_023879 [Puccinia striiformis f. sp. tritici]
MSESAFKNHAEEIQRKIQKSQLDLGQIANGQSSSSQFRSTSGLHDPPRIMSYSTVLAPSTTSSEIIDTFKWSPISFEFVHQHALAVMVQAVLGSLLDGRSEKNINNFLKAEIEKVKMSSQYKTSEMNAILKQIPETLQTSGETWLKFGCNFNGVLPRLLCFVPASSKPKSRLGARISIKGCPRITTDIGSKIHTCVGGRISTCIATSTSQVSCSDLRYNTNIKT